jgi:hypothetical protein
MISRSGDPCKRRILGAGEIKKAEIPVGNAGILQAKKYGYALGSLILLIRFGSS